MTVETFVKFYIVTEDVGASLPIWVVNLMMKAVLADVNLNIVIYCENPHDGFCRTGLKFTHYVYNSLRIKSVTNSDRLCPFLRNLSSFINRSFLTLTLPHSSCVCSVAMYHI